MVHRVVDTSPKSHIALLSSFQQVSLARVKHTFRGISVYKTTLYSKEGDAMIAIRQNTSGPTSTVTAAEATNGASLGIGSSNSATKSTLEWIFIALVCILILSVISRRMMQLRARQIPVWNFFRSPRPVRAHSVSTPGYTLPRLTSIPTAYHPPARMRAVGTAQEVQGDKDALPAYDNAGGPPKYDEIGSTFMPRVDSERVPSVSNTINTRPTFGSETHSAGPRS
ncbi:uncharacterized protein BT62DRAFT_1079556 [Guyanagaster necrorhizus]|uniref:Uncharacterized protein n=1 Tax=Guyanagaster necrorhizus TaxID=856835 RepID=A0A9P7VKH6_9AGAR|nr:uncharacterized protein BT62DRAFT_1079556 [Guyanagaster necrorhizus MCA 3950]KAG7442020.1 hypothetical protein BT62DRAFT_1079556 [Guyanagaster necrorhizus MCA 3950]